MYIHQIYAYTHVYVRMYTQSDSRVINITIELQCSRTNKYYFKIYFKITRHGKKQTQPYH